MATTANAVNIELVCTRANRNEFKSKIICNFKLHVLQDYLLFNRLCGGTEFDHRKAENPNRESERKQKQEEVLCCPFAVFGC